MEAITTTAYLMPHHDHPDPKSGETTVQRIQTTSELYAGLISIKLKAALSLMFLVSMRIIFDSAINLPNI